MSPSSFHGSIFHGSKSAGRRHCLALFFSGVCGVSMQVRVASENFEKVKGLPLTLGCPAVRAQFDLDGVKTKITDDADDDTDEVKSAATKDLKSWWEEADRLHNSSGGSGKEEGVKKNVLFIIMDDVNTDVEGFRFGHPQAKTPNLVKFAETATKFQRAYANHPLCAPSRGSFMYGVYGHRSGYMSNSFNFKQVPAYQKICSLPQYFANNGYLTFGTGKIFHQQAAEHFQAFGTGTDYGPLAFNESGDLVSHPSISEPQYSQAPLVSFGRLSKIPGDGKGKAGWYKTTFDEKFKKMHYKNDNDRDLLGDEESARWASQQLGELGKRKDNCKPFFMNVGFVKPHLPIHVPDKYFDMFPLEDLQLPEIKRNDSDDVAFKALGGHRLFDLSLESFGEREKSLKHLLQAYLAAIAFMDEQVGVVLDALEESGLSEKTIVVVASDHGFHIGQKDVLGKDTPWSESLHVPLFIRAPGVTQEKTSVAHPVSLIDLYPTLVDLTGLQNTNKIDKQGLDLDGHSLRPFIEKPHSIEIPEKWTGSEAVLSEVIVYNEFGQERSQPIPGSAFRYHLSVTTKELKYIVVANEGGRELYNVTNDPYEWDNLWQKEKQESNKDKVKELMWKMTACDGVEHSNCK